MIILVANGKGGVGKSSVCCNLAAALVQQGKDTLLVDADQQSTTSRFVRTREAFNSQHPIINCAQRYGPINRTLTDFDNRYEFVLVDVAGYMGSDEMNSALHVADILIMPFRPSQLDLDELPSMVKAIKKAQWINDKLRSYVLLSMAPTNIKVNDIAGARESLLEYPEVTLLNSIISDRKIYRTSMGEGLGAVEMDGKSDSEVNSRREVLALTQEILDGI